MFYIRTSDILCFFFSLSFLNLMPLLVAFLLSLANLSSILSVVVKTDFFINIFIFIKEVNNTALVN